MKLVVLLWLFASAFNCASSADAITDRILDVLRRQIPAEKQPKLGKQVLPTQDPIHFETQHLDLCGPILCISANLTNAVITGLTGYDILKLNFNPDGTTVIVDIDLFFSSIKLDAGYYEMQGNIMDAFPLAGKGHLFFEATDFRVWAKVIMQVADRTFIDEFKDSGFSIKAISSRTEFDGNIDGIFNAMVEDLLADYLNRFNKVIAANCGAVIKDLLNPYL